MPSRLSPRHLRQILPPAGDRELLRAYAQGGDPAAFDHLARRYAGLARRAAADVCPAAADDVAQAALALLGRKAAGLVERESAAGWVFEAARRLAQKARTAAARRTRHEARAIPPAPPPDPLDELTFREVRAAVAAEVARLPDDLRVPLVLCYWEGASQPAAADRLGCSVSTLKRRLEAGRDRLAARLARRGFAGSAVLAALTALQVAQSSPHTPCAGYGTRSVPPTLGRSPKSVLLAVAVSVVAASALALGLAPAGDPPTPPKDSKAVEVVAAPSPGLDAFGDPLPDGAVARLGTVRFRTVGFPKHVVVSPDGKRVVTTAAHGRVHLALWEADTGRPLREVEVPGHAWPEAVCWPADGRGRAMFKTGLKDYVVWEFTDPEARTPVGVRSMSYGPGSFTVSAFSPDGALIAAGERAGRQGTEGKLNVWPVHPGRPVREAPPLFTRDTADQFVALSFTPDGKRLVGLTQGREPDRVVRPAGPGLRGFEPGARADMARVAVWDVATWKEVIAFDVVTGGLAPDTLTSSPRHAVSPDGRTLYTPTQDAHVKAFDLATGKERFDAVAFGPPGEETKKFLPTSKSQIGELAITPDGRTLVVAELMGRIVGLDAATGKELWRGGREIDPTYGIAMFPDSKRFALGHGARQVGVYDVATGKALVEPAGVRGMLKDVGVSPDGRAALTVGWDAVLRHWDLGTGRMTAAVPAQGGTRIRMTGVSPDGKRVVGPDGLLDTATGKLVAPLPLAELTPRYWYGPTLAAWLPDGSAVVSGGANRAARFAADGKMLADYVIARPAKGEADVPVEGVAVSPDGKTVVLTGEGAPGGMLRSATGWVTVFDAAGARVREWPSRAGAVTAVAFLPDGGRVALGRWVREQPRGVNDPPPAPVDLAAAVALLDPATGEATTPFEVPDPTAEYRWVKTLAVSPTGAQVAVVEDDYSLTVYETASGAIRRRLRGHRGPVERLAFTPDGRRLVSVSEDGTGLVWDVAPPRPAAAIPLTDADRDRRWAALLMTDGPAAHRAMGELAADPAGTVAFLKAHLKPTPAPTAADLDRLLARLAAAGFAERQAAARDLDQWGSLGLAVVRAKLPDVSSAEVRQRLDEFLKRHDVAGRTTGRRLREVRAVELLEGIGTPDALAVLTALATGDTPLARDATAAVRRLRGQ